MEPPRLPGSKFVRVFGLIPLGIGVTVIGFLWGAPFGQFGSPPLFFRVFGSFIALAFVFVGSGLLFAKPPGGHGKLLDALRDANAEQDGRQAERGQGGYACTQCGAPLDEEADVSPHGDVKCTFCNCWFNIHKK